MDNRLPLAEPEREEIAKRIFSEYETMPPEEWAARFSHSVGCSSFGEYHYANTEFDNWIHRLHEIFRSPVEDISIYRKQYLSEHEIREIEDQLNDPYGL